MVIIMKMTAGKYFIQVSCQCFLNAGTYDTYQLEIMKLSG